MSPIALTIYVLMWPVIVAGVMFVIGRAFLKEARGAKRRGETIV